MIDDAVRDPQDVLSAIQEGHPSAIADFRGIFEKGVRFLLRRSGLDCAQTIDAVMTMAVIRAQSQVPLSACELPGIVLDAVRRVREAYAGTKIMRVGIRGEHCVFAALLEKHLTEREREILSCYYLAGGSMEGICERFDVRAPDLVKLRSFTQALFHQLPLTETADENRAKGSVLVVDDEKAVCDFVAGVLESNGYDVACAQSGAQALDVLRSHRVDLLLTDVCMPEISGVELSRAVRSHQPETKVLFMSGNSNSKTVRDIRSAGLPFLAKPLHVDILALRVHTMVAA